MKVKGSLTEADRWLLFVDNPSICRICKWVEFAPLPLKPLRGGWVSSRAAHFDRACTCELLQASATVCFDSSHMCSQGEPGGFLKVPWHTQHTHTHKHTNHSHHTHTLLIETQNILRSFTIPFSPSALGFLADILPTKEEGRADVWFADGLRKASWSTEVIMASVWHHCLTTAGHHPLPQKMKLNLDAYCYSDRWSDWCCFLLILPGNWPPVSN